MKNLINRSDLEQEIWLPVVGYEGLYEVSNLGRVKSVKYDKERILKPIKQANGYLFVNLYKDGKEKHHLVHRLVAQAFLDNPHNYPEVNHINDEDKTDNRAESLEWCDRKYNCNYGTRNQRVGKVLSKPVLQLTLDGELVREWSSTHEAQRQGGFDQSAISHCCSGRHKTHSGYIWKYIGQP